MIEIILEGFFTASLFKGGVLGLPSHACWIESRYGRRDLRFISWSCFRRVPLLRSIASRNILVRILDEASGRYSFALISYVIMLKHIHLRIGRKQNAGGNSPPPASD